MMMDNSDNVEYFLYKFNISNLDKKRILFLKKFYNNKINKNTFSKENFLKILYFNGEQSVNDLINFEIFKSKKISKKLINLLNYFKDKKPPIFPIKAKNLMQKYNISEGKLLGVKLNKIEEKWINNNFNISDNEISKIIKD